jgi:uncharacterized membrane protein
VNRRALVLIGAFALFGALVGCDDGAASWARGATAANAAADEAIATENWDAARRLLREAVDREVPGAVAAEDARVVRQDLLYRMTLVEIEAGEFSAAADRADEGLNLGRADDVFTANLLVARARAREGLDRPREAAGDYFDALEINEELLGEALGE